VQELKRFFLRSKLQIRQDEPDINIHGLGAWPRRAGGPRELAFGLYDPRRRAGSCQRVVLTVKNRKEHKGTEENRKEQLFLHFFFPSEDEDDDEHENDGAKGGAFGPEPNFYASDTRKSGTRGAFRHTRGRVCSPGLKFGAKEDE